MCICLLCSILKNLEYALSTKKSKISKTRASLRSELLCIADPQYATGPITRTKVLLEKSDIRTKRITSNFSHIFVIFLQSHERLEKDYIILKICYGFYFLLYLVNL